MLLESVFAIGGGVLIGAFAYARSKHSRRAADVEAERNLMQDWPAYEKDRRAYAEEMRIAGAVSDAKRILHMQYAGRSASRRTMLKQGISERRWRQAIFLLRSLHVYDKAGYVPVTSERFALQRLDRFQRTHAARITRSPASYVSPLR